MTPFATSSATRRAPRNAFLAPPLPSPGITSPGFTPWPCWYFRRKGRGGRSPPVTIVPCGVLELLSKRFRALGAGEMGRLLKQAAQHTPMGLPRYLTPDGRCHGANIHTYRLVSSYPEFFYVTNWELTGQILPVDILSPQTPVVRAVARFLLCRPCRWPL